MVTIITLFANGAGGVVPSLPPLPHPKSKKSEDENISLQSLKELGKAIGTIGGQVKKIETGVLGMFQGFQPEHLTSAKRPEITDGKE